MSQCHSVTVSQCHSVTVSQCHSVTVSQCYSDTVIQYYSITVLKCHSVTVSQYKKSQITNHERTNYCLPVMYKRYSQHTPGRSGPSTYTTVLWNSIEIGKWSVPNRFVNEIWWQKDMLSEVCLLLTNISFGSAGTLADQKCKRSLYDKI